MQKRKIKKERPVVPLTTSLIETLVVYLLSDYINRPFLTKLRIFFDTVDINFYKQDGDLEPYFRIASRLVDVYLDDRIQDVNLAYEKITSSPTEKEDIENFLEEIKIEKLLEKMDANLAVFLENEFISRLNYTAINPLVIDIKTAISKFESEDFISYEEGVKNIQTNVSKLNKAIIAKSTTSISIPDIDFDNDDSFIMSVSKARTFMNDTKRIIKTGIKRFNKMLGGGFHGGRVYVINAISGGWKSGLLLNIAIWAAKYNPDIVCNDASKSPCVLYLTQENDNQETMERLFSYIGAVDEDGKALSEAEIYEKFVENKIRGSRWSFKVKYRPKNSITTGDIDGLINEIESENDVEVKMVVHDYIKRIKPDNAVGDLRIDIGEAINDMSIIAKARKIPIITANQLNREAYRVLEKTAEIRKDGTKEQKIDMGRKIDQSMISESNMLLENADWVGAIHREFSIADKQLYLAFKNLKDRSDKNGSVITDNYFAHPFDGDNGMRLMEDYYLAVSKSLESLQNILGSFITEDDEEFEESDDENKPRNKKKESKFDKKIKSIKLGQLEAEIEED